MCDKLSRWKKTVAVKEQEFDKKSDVVIDLTSDDCWTTMLTISCSGCYL